MLGLYRLKLCPVNLIHSPSIIPAQVCKFHCKLFASQRPAHFAGYIKLLWDMNFRVMGGYLIADLCKLDEQSNASLDTVLYIHGCR